MTAPHNPTWPHTTQQTASNRPHTVPAAVLCWQLLVLQLWGRSWGQAGGPAAHEGFVPARSSMAFLTRSVGRGARTVRFVDGTNRDGSLVVRQLGWVPVTMTSARLITPALVAGDCTLT